MFICLFISVNYSHPPPLQRPLTKTAHFSHKSSFSPQLFDRSKSLMSRHSHTGTLPRTQGLPALDSEARARIVSLETTLSSTLTRLSRVEAELSALASAQGVGGARIDSLIISDFPTIFTEFRGKIFRLLWRGSRDGFGASDFHSRCDGHTNTLTIIADTKGNVFGGFTPVAWESCGKALKGDGSRKSFLYTLRNPHNVPARRFALKEDAIEKAIWCDSEGGPNFGDIGVFDNCNENQISGTYGFGYSYTNDTGLEGNKFFTGAQNFRVKEIEVFEIVS
jgi:hypothetical protein